MTPTSPRLASACALKRPSAWVSWPNSAMRPAAPRSMRSSPQTRRMRVDLPEPEAPMRPTISPSPTSSSMSCSPVFRPKVLLTPERVMTDMRPAPFTPASAVAWRDGGTAVHALEPADEADEGRLAGARGADEADHLALADLELDVVQHGLPAEGLADARKRDDGHAAGPLEAGLGGCLAESSTGAG